MLAKFRHSLALRLASLYGVLFAAGAALVFVVLYLFLAEALETKDQKEVERMADSLTAVYNSGGPLALRARLAEAQAEAKSGSLFIRVVERDGNTLFALVPTDWIETQVQRIEVPGSQGGWKQQELQTVRVPQNAEKDFTVSARSLRDGRLLQVARSSDNRATLLAPLRSVFWKVAPGALLLSALGGGFVVWRATRPLRSVNQTTRRILETGDLDARVPVPSGRGELVELVQQLNRVLAQNGSLIKAQRETLDNLAHDLRTPLARLRGVAELALQDQAGDPARASEALADCVEESERVLRLLEVMLDVSAAETGTMSLRKEPVSLRALAERALDLYREVAEEKQVQISLEGEDTGTLQADPLRLGQAVANLVDNAIKYTPQGGRVLLRIAQESTMAILEVSDSGPGIPEAERDKVWKRLYRLDGSRSQRGLGLGLSLVKAIVEAHGGAVEIGASPLGGARFLLQLSLRPSAT